MLYYGHLSLSTFYVSIYTTGDDYLVDYHYFERKRRLLGALSLSDYAHIIVFEGGGGAWCSK